MDFFESRDVLRGTARAGDLVTLVDASWEAGRCPTSAHGFAIALTDLLFRSPAFTTATYGRQGKPPPETADKVFAELAAAGRLVAVFAGDPGAEARRGDGARPFVSGDADGVLYAVVLKAQAGDPFYTGDTDAVWALKPSGAGAFGDNQWVAEELPAAFVAAITPETAAVEDENAAVEDETAAVEDENAAVEGLVSDE
jgi:hypothetical protein